MERLWAPWRIEYIEACDKADGCIFCMLPERGNDEEELILLRGKTAFVIMNRYPYTNGHLMVAPFKHTANMYDLSDEELVEINHLVRYCVRALEHAMHPHGFNLGVNLGRVAGAGVENHIHWHIVPRWSGDTNFMPVLGDVRVISEGLTRTYGKLKAAMEELGAP